MDYKTASETRKKSFSDIFVQKMADGQGIGSSIKSTFSEKTKSNLIGVKEKFDPMNIAKAIGGKAGAAIYGRVMGRSKEDTAHIAGIKIKDKKLKGDGELNSSSSSASDALGLIYRLLMRAYDEESEKRNSNLEERKKEDAEENSRNKLLIQAFKVKREKTRGEKKADRRRERKAEKKTKKEEAKPTEPTPTKENKPSATSIKPTETKPTTTTAPNKPTESAKPTTEKVTTPSKETRPTVKPSKGIAGQVAAASGLIGSITAGLTASGITNTYAQTAVVANIGKESGFQLKSENMKYTSVERLKEVFPSKFGKMSDAEAAEYTNNPEKLGNFIYGGQYGNKDPGDGFKYRGRGSIGLTFRGQYESTAKEIGVPQLATNPDLANDPEINTKIVVNYMKKNIGLQKMNSLTDQMTANRVVTQAVGGKALNLDVGIGAEILNKVNNYSAVISNPAPIPSSASAGAEIDQSSKTNRELKKDMENTESQDIVNNNTTVNKTNKTNKSSPPEDDRNVYIKKSQGQ
jgi:predicted chitinase